MRSAIIGFATLLMGCQASNIPTTHQRVQNLEFQQYAEAIERVCVLRSSTGHMTGPRNMNQIVVQFILEGTVNGQSGWRSISYTSTGRYGNFYHDTNEGYHYCDGTFADMGLSFRPD